MLPFRMVLLALLISIGLAGPSALADDLTGTLKKIKDSGTITIGNRESSVPFSYLDEHGTPVGYSVDLCNRVVEEVKKTLSLPDLKVQYMTVAPAARIPLLSNGTIDLECSTTDRTLSRMRQVAFSVPTFVIGGRILTKVGSGVTDWGDLHGKVIGVAQGTHTEQLVNARCYAGLCRHARPDAKGPCSGFAGAGDRTGRRVRHRRYRLVRAAQHVPHEGPAYRYRQAAVG